MIATVRQIAWGVKIPHSTRKIEQETNSERQVQKWFTFPIRVLRCAPVVMPAELCSSGVKLGQSEFPPVLFIRRSPKTE